MDLSFNKIVKLLFFFNLHWVTTQSSLFAQEAVGTPQVIVGDEVEEGTEQYLIQGIGWSALVGINQKTEIYLLPEFVETLEASPQEITLEEISQDMVVEELGANKNKHPAVQLDYGKFLEARKSWIENIAGPGSDNQIESSTLESLRLTPVKAIEKILMGVVSTRFSSGAYSIPEVENDCYECLVSPFVQSDEVYKNEVNLIKSIQRDGLETLQENVLNERILGDISAFVLTQLDPHSNIGEDPLGEISFNAFIISGGLLGYGLLPVQVPTKTLPIIKGKIDGCSAKDYFCYLLIKKDPLYRSMLREEMYVYLLSKGRNEVQARELSDRMIDMIQTGKFGRDQEQIQANVDILTQIIFDLSIYPQYVAVNIFHELEKKFGLNWEQEGDLKKFLKYRYQLPENSDYRLYLEIFLRDYVKGVVNPSDIESFARILGERFIWMKEDFSLPLETYMNDVNVLNQESEIHALSFLRGVKGKKYQRERVHELLKSSGRLEGLSEREAKKIVDDSIEKIGSSYDQVNLLVGVSNSPGNQDKFDFEFGFPDRVLLGLEIVNPVEETRFSTYLIGTHVNMNMVDQLNPLTDSRISEDVATTLGVTGQTPFLESKTEVSLGALAATSQTGEGEVANYLDYQSSLEIFPLKERSLSLEVSGFGRYNGPESSYSSLQVGGNYSGLITDDFSFTLYQGAKYSTSSRDYHSRDSAYSVGVSNAPEYVSRVEASFVNSNRLSLVSVSGGVGLAVPLAPFSDLSELDRNAMIRLTIIPKSRRLSTQTNDDLNDYNEIDQSDRDYLLEDGDKRED